MCNYYFLLGGYQWGCIWLLFGAKSTSARSLEPFLFAICIESLSRLIRIETATPDFNHHPSCGAAQLHRALLLQMTYFCFIELIRLQSLFDQILEVRRKKSTHSPSINIEPAIGFDSERPPLDANSIFSTLPSQSIRVSVSVPSH